MGILAYAAEHIRRLGEARTAYEAAAAGFRALGERNGLFSAANNLAMMLIRAGDLDVAEMYCQESLAAANPDDQLALSCAYDTLVSVYLPQGPRGGDPIVPVGG